MASGPEGCVCRGVNLTKVRSQFPFLERKYQGKPLAFLDNASTTQKPQVVIDAISDVYKNHYANIHRGVYDLSVEATELYENTRAQVRDLISAKSEKEIVFTRNTTESLNLLAYTLGANLGDGDEILLTQMEHHSNIVPFQLLAERLKTNAKRKIKIKYIPITDDGRLDMSSLDRLVTKKTKIVSLTLMSNVLGTINPIKEIVSRVRSLGSKPIIIVDAAQAVGHMKVDVSELDCDFLAFSAHKMYGPSGVGVLWGKQEILEKMPPFMGGGDMILSVDFEKTTFAEIPWKFEAGTPSIADVIAFGKAINFVEKLGLENIRKHEMELTDYALKLLSSDSDITIYGPGSQTVIPAKAGIKRKILDRVENDNAGARGAVVAFNVDGIHPHDVASILSEEAVAIRSGHHCAQPLMSVLGIDPPATPEQAQDLRWRTGAACRVSFGIYNTKEEVDRLIAGLRKVRQVFRLSGHWDTRKNLTHKPSSLVP